MTKISMSTTGAVRAYDWKKGRIRLVMIVSMDKRGDLKEREEFLQDVLSRAFDRALERYDRERDAKARTEAEAQRWFQDCGEDRDV